MIYFERTNEEMHSIFFSIRKLYWFEMFPASYPSPPPSASVALHGFNPSNAASDEALVSFGYKI